MKYINFIDINGNEETVYNCFTEDFKNKAFKKQNQLNDIGILICETNTFKSEKTIPDNIYNKAIKIINSKE